LETRAAGLANPAEKKNEKKYNNNYYYYYRYYYYKNFGQTSLILLLI
jgi:hypothetical protein